MRRVPATDPGARAQLRSSIAPAPGRCPVCGGLLGEPLLSSPDRLHGVPGAFSVALCQICGVGVTLPSVEPHELAAFYPTTYGAYELPAGAAGLVSAAVRAL